jgi:hypothetical protein
VAVAVAAQLTIPVVVELLALAVLVAVVMV